ncbi:MAG TPA: hypothetical protein VLA77_02250 [Candidatus Saccharimonadales bacterium]|nr:hypothetical protein [Candidatus Saccharimonadales bacterium]
MEGRIPDGPEAVLEGVIAGRRAAGRKSKMTGTGCLITVVIVGFLVACCCGAPNFPLFFSGTAVVTVCDKDPKQDQYRVSVSDGVTREVYVVEDMHLPIVAWRTDAADLYYRLDKGKVYEITYRGIRWTPGSRFRNIETATHLPNAVPKGC